MYDVCFLLYLSIFFVLHIQILATFTSWKIWVKKCLHIFSVSYFFSSKIIFLMWRKDVSSWCTREGFHACRTKSGHDHRLWQKTSDYCNPFFGLHKQPWSRIHRNVFTLHVSSCRYGSVNPSWKEMHSDWSYLISNRSLAAKMLIYKISRQICLTCTCECGQRPSEGAHLSSILGPPQTLQLGKLAGCTDKCAQALRREGQTQVNKMHNIQFTMCKNQKHYMKRNHTFVPTLEDFHNVHSVQAQCPVLFYYLVVVYNNALHVRFTANIGYA